MSETKLIPQSSIRPGCYQHYKGKNYEVLGLAQHSETGEQLVVYRCLYGDYGWWVRPHAMFLEAVEIAGERIPRFRYMGPRPSAEIAECDGAVDD